MWPALVWGRDTTRYRARYHDPVIVARDSTLKMLVLYAATWGRCWEIRVRLREDAVELQAMLSMVVLSDPSLIESLRYYFVSKMPLFQACSNCGSQIHVRKLACLCGHVFCGSKALTIKDITSDLLQHSTTIDT